MQAKISTIMVLLVSSFATGCTTIKKLDPDELKAVSQRTYSDVTKQQMLANAESILRKIDSSHRATLAISKDRITLYRTYGLTSLGSSLDFSVDSEGDALRTYLVSSIKGGGRELVRQNSGDYNLFYDRIDALLGKRAWVTCAEAEKDKERYSPPMTALCDGAEENTP